MSCSGRLARRGQVMVLGEAFLIFHQNVEFNGDTVRLTSFQG